MNIRQTLKEYPILQAKLKVIETELDFLETDLSVGGISYDTIGGGSGKISDMTANEAIQYGEKRTILENEKKQCEQICNLIDLSLKGLTAQERKVIKMYYFQEKKWEDVAGVLGCTIRTCINNRDSAIKKIEQVFEHQNKIYKRDATK